MLIAHDQEGLDDYLVVAAIPNLDPDELQASLSDDKTALIVKGLGLISVERTLPKIRPDIWSKLWGVCKRGTSFGVEMYEIYM